MDSGSFQTHRYQGFQAVSKYPGVLFFSFLRPWILKSLTPRPQIIKFYPLSILQSLDRFSRFYVSKFLILRLLSKHLDTKLFRIAISRSLCRPQMPRFSSIVKPAGLQVSRLPRSPCVYNLTLQVYRVCLQVCISRLLQVYTGLVLL